MDDATAVQRGERPENGERDRHCVVEQHRAVFEAIVERLAGEQLHHDEDVVVDFADVEDLADGGMTDAGGGARLAPQPCAGVVAIH